MLRRLRLWLRFFLWLRRRLTLRCDRRRGFFLCVRLRLERLRLRLRPVFARLRRLRVTRLFEDDRLRLRVTRLAALRRGFFLTRRARLRRLATSFLLARLRLRLTGVFAVVLRLRLRVTRFTVLRATRRLAPLRLRFETSFRARLRFLGAATRLLDTRLRRFVVLVLVFLILRMAAPDPFRVTPRASRARRFRPVRLRRVVLGVALPPARRAAARFRDIAAKRSRAANCFAVGREFRLMAEPPVGRR
jgi:hypothetical protein